MPVRQAGQLIRWFLPSRKSMRCWNRWQKWLLLKDLTMTAGKLVVGLDRLRDPGNLGTILRTCDAAGVKAVVLIDHCTDPYAPECVRATMGSLFHVPLVKCTTAEFIEWKNAVKAEVYGTHL